MTQRPPESVVSAHQVSPHQVSQLRVDEAGEEQRLDNFLSRVCKGVPKSHLYRLIRSGQVRVNGRRARADLRLQINDIVRLPPMRVASRPGSPDKPTMAGNEHARLGRELPIAYEDDVLIAVNKPAGVAVHGGSGLSSGVIEQLRAARRDARFLELVHRLDRETSGLLMVAKKRSALRTLHDQLRRGRMQKIYSCVVIGRLAARDRTIRLALKDRRGSNGEKVVMVDSQGKPAITHVIGQAWSEDSPVGSITRARVRIETGRTHQIRVHMAALGYPVLGDRRYGNFQINKGLPSGPRQRMYLHAWQLSLSHPVTGKRLELTAELPDVFDQLMSQSSQ